MPSIHVSESNGVRHLHIGSDLVQGAMRIARPHLLELEYTRQMMVPLDRSPSTWPASVLQVGLGAASITRYLHRYRPEAKLTVVELLPGVVAAARQFFKLPEESARLRIEIGDGHDYLAATKRRFDLILVDGFDGAGRAGMLESLPFYLNARRALKRGGMLSANFLALHRSPEASLARLREAFDGQVEVLARCASGNTVAVATTRRGV